MVVTPPADDPKWAYRRPAVDRIIAAVRAMLTQRAVGGQRRALPNRHG